MPPQQRPIPNRPVQPTQAAEEAASVRPSPEILEPETGGAIPTAERQESTVPGEATAPVRSPIDVPQVSQELATQFPSAEEGLVGTSSQLRSDEDELLGLADEILQSGDALVGEDEINALFDQQQALLEEQQAFQTEQSESATASSVEATEAQQNRQGRQLQRDLVRIGGFLGESASGTGALINLNNAFRSELTDIRDRGQAALQEINFAFQQGNIDVLRERMNALQDLQDRLTSSRQNYLDNRLNIEREQQQNQTADITEYNFAVEQGFSGSFTDFVDRNQSVSSATSDSTPLFGDAVESMGLPADLEGTSSAQIAKDIQSDTPPSWFTSRFVSGIDDDEFKNSGKLRRKTARKIRRGKIDVEPREGTGVAAEDFELAKGTEPFEKGAKFRQRRPFLDEQEIQEAWNAFRGSSAIRELIDTIKGSESSSSTGSRIIRQASGSGGLSTDIY